MSEKVVTLELTPEFAAFLEQVHRQHNIDHNCINQPMIALDPGETTGVAIFNGDTTITVYQKETKEVGPSFVWFLDLLEGGPKFPNLTMDVFAHIRCEDYRIYEWKSADHSWSQVHTLRWIGAIMAAAHWTSTPLSFCMAQHAKKFWTDEKLKHFGLYPTGLRHGKDALRHLLYYLLYPTKAE
jgi:hypothetical protein